LRLAIKNYLILKDQNSKTFFRMSNVLLINSLKILKKIYLISKPESSSFGRNWKMFSAKDYANDLIYKKLIDEEPCMIARFGAFELNCVVNYLGIKNQHKSYKSFIMNQTPSWWWDKTLIQHMKTNAGFFPIKIGNLEKFCELMLEDILQVDILGSWLKEERFVYNRLERAKRVVLEDLEPFFSTKPWTRALERKKVLVIHPFVETIKIQYQKRELLFENNMLPDFELKTIKAVQSIAGTKTEFSDWFELKSIQWITISVSLVQEHTGFPWQLM
jgi:hypothetical protein